VNSFSRKLKTRIYHSFILRIKASIFLRARGGSRLVVIQAKTAFVGDGTVGKTSLINSFTGKTSFMEQYLMTIGVNIVVHSAERDNGTKINLCIWDMGGQQRFSSIRGSFYKGSQLIVYVYDISNKESFDNLANWLKEVHKALPINSYKGVLVGNKADLDEIRIIDLDTAKEFADAKGFQYIETSAKDGTGTSELINILAENVIRKNSLQNNNHTAQKIVGHIETVSDPSLTSFF
jgi:Ras-related protein Rab-1A